MKAACKKAVGHIGAGMRRVLRPLAPVYRWGFEKCYKIGKWTIRYTVKFAAMCERAIAPPIRAVGAIICAFMNNILDFMQGVADWADGVIALCMRALSKLFKAFFDGFRKGGVIEAWNRMRGAYREGRAHNQRAVWLTKMVVLPLIPLIALTVFINVFTGLNFALAVSVEGENIGFISSEDVYNEADKMMQQRIVYVDGQEPVQVQPTYNLSIVGGDQIVNESELCDNLIVASGAKVSEASGVFVDGTLLGATTDETTIKAFLQAKLAQYETDNPEDKVSFTRDVQVQDGLYLTESLVESNALEEKLDGKTQEKKEYIAVSGDTPIGIAAKYGLTVAELEAMNPGIRQQLFIGMSVTVASEQNFLGVQVTKRMTYEQDIPYETVKENSSQYTKGTTKTTVKGQNGSAQVTADIVYVDGVEVSRTVLESVTTKEPVTEKILVGTKSITVSGGSIWGGSSSVSGTGSFFWPVPDRTTITCGWYGYAGHRAIDIGAPTGTSIHAVDSGTVTYAGWYLNYGNCVIINHGNGIQTLYAHQSAILVSVGQVVSRGQQIGRVGATGKAYGSHLHLEVIVNGVKVNPTQFF